VSVVKESIADGVCNGGISDVVVPLLDGELAGDDGGARAVAIVHDLEQVTALGFTDRDQAEVVEDEDVGAGDSAEQTRIGAVGLSERELIEEMRQACWASAQAMKVLPTPVAPVTITAPRGRFPSARS
jgi:hypothetical protein